jgi:hypothetical protein
VILKFRFFGISIDEIIKEICNAIINMIAQQLAIILALVAFRGFRSKWQNVKKIFWMTIFCLF